MATNERYLPLGKGAVRSGTRQLNDATIRFRTANLDPDPDLPSLVLVHQSPLSSRRYARLLPHLVDFCNPYALDTPGYGESQSPDPDWTGDDYGQIITDFTESLDGNESFLFGRATGSVFALLAAVQKPELFRGLILHGLPVYTDDEKSDRLASFAPPYVVGDDGQHLLWIWERVHTEYPWIDAELATSMVSDYLDAGPDFASAYRAIWRTDLVAAAKLLGTPTLLLSGERDRLLHMFSRSTELLPWAASTLIPGATDFVAEQDPTRFAEILRNFVVSVSAERAT